MSNEVRLIDANTLKKAIELFCEDERTNMTAIAYFALMELVDTMPTIEAEPVKHDTELSSILQDYGIKDTDTLRYILDQYQKIIVDITGGQMSYLTYPAQAVIDCTNDYYLSALADLKESSNNEAEPDNGWISVKDRLPEYDKTVLVVNEDGYMHTAVRIKDSIARIDEWQIKFGVYFIDNDVWEEDEQGKITHWRPLPSTEGLNEA